MSQRICDLMRSAHEGTVAVEVGLWRGASGSGRAFFSGSEPRPAEVRELVPAGGDDWVHSGKRRAPRSPHRQGLLNLYF